MADDASRLNATAVFEIWDMPRDEAEAETGLRALLLRARSRGLRVSIAGARHSMGGQTIYPGGIEINILPHNAMQLDQVREMLHVQAGARWSEIVPYLDTFQRSVAVMQSNNSFSVGGSLSVNCHGWQTDRPPIDSTFESFRLMRADGSIIRCSRSENPELFSLTFGGCGLFGVILNADLRVVANERYRLHQIVVPGDQFISAWNQRVEDSSDVGMALGRLSVAPDSFLNEAILYVFTRAPTASGNVPGLSDPGMGQLARTLLLGSVGSDYGKRLRWTVERDLLTHVTSAYFTRNQLLNVPAELLENRTGNSTDVLQEYFIPKDHVKDFLKRLRIVIPKIGADLLNVTLRAVKQDRDSLLRYAVGDMMSFVMLFNQPSGNDAEERMEYLTRQLINAALDCGGRYYLPYRLRATSGQFLQAYPQAKHFFELKRQYDPDELFQNEFYVKYGRGSLS
ncbi:MAG TPA: FAD-binding oxidoreductase [Tepidisphaeraceae bacterium]|nr:FAD-binding oxidoreductase [Tepidisphaeraceae bacterium]